MEHLVNWFFGNFCAHCGIIDMESENYGKNHFEKMQLIIESLKKEGINEMTHKEFSDLIHTGTTFCKPIKRIYNDCKTCKKLGVPQRK